ncbi:MAG TPA: response regulator [Nitrospiria bacterium]|nr:response regulator [Nitrospiria bacterium]
MNNTKKDDIKPFEVLLIENNPVDVDLTRMAFEDRALPYRLHVAKDGVEAMSFLHRKGPFADAPRPDLILLEIRIPGKSGLEVLAEIKGDVDFNQIPVVILTSSKTDRDIQRSYSLHANCYVVKPVDLDEYIGAVQRIEDFWLTHVKLPSL